MTEDSTLIQRYSRTGNEEAFAELVHRHLGLVYSVALRQVGGDVHLAQDVAQTVFTALARKARALEDCASLGGWLYRSTRFAASDTVRAERRRRAHEREIRAMQEVTPTAPTLDWEKLRPVLDDAISALSDRDRDAICLRFLDGRNYADIARRLRVSENGARMRVERALDRLHASLAQRGVTSTAAALAVALPGQALAAVPTGLATTLTQSVLAAALAGASGWTTLFALMNTTKITVSIATLVTVAAVVTAFRINQQADADAAAARAAQTAAAEKIAALEDEIARTRAALVSPPPTPAPAAVIPAATPALQYAPPPPPADNDITEALVSQRLQRARELARDGQTAAALAEYLWCYDIGTPRFSRFFGVRGTMPSEIAKLGASLPAALTALRERRDLAEERFVAGNGEFADASAVASLNRALDDVSRSVQLYDSLPPDSAQRGTLQPLLYDQFVAAQRYGDALAGRQFNQMSSRFEMFITRTPPNDASGATAARYRHYAIADAATDIEVLAATGDIAHAAELALRVLEYDESPDTIALLKQHAARAGQTGLIDTLRAVPPKRDVSPAAP